MDDKKRPPAAVTAFQPRPADINATIRRIAEDSALVFFSKHAIERMELREVTRLEAVRVLRSGRIVGEIERGQNPGEWKCKVVAKLKGSRETGVVTLVINNQRLLVKTVEWEDVS